MTTVVMIKSRFDLITFVGHTPGAIQSAGFIAATGVLFHIIKFHIKTENSDVLDLHCTDIMAMSTTLLKSVKFNGRTEIILGKSNINPS